MDFNHELLKKYIPKDIAGIKEDFKKGSAEVFDSTKKEVVDNSTTSEQTVNKYVVNQMERISKLRTNIDKSFEEHKPKNDDDYVVSEEEKRMTDEYLKQSEELKLIPFYKIAKRKKLQQEMHENYSKLISFVEGRQEKNN